jgi:DNA repair protein RadD
VAEVKLRPYQRDAVLELLAYWRTSSGNALIDLPTGTGKSIVAAELARRFCQHGHRVLIVSHVREIVEQDATAIRAVWPDMPPRTLGINSAALNERATDTPIVVATVQSIFRNSRALGERQLAIIDEAHRVPPGETGIYHATLAGLRALNPTLQVVGFSATCYRLDSGRLDEGDDKLFDKVVYSYPIADTIRDGWLAPLIAKGTEAAIDVSGVHVRGGEFVAGELERAANRNGLVDRAVDEIVAYGAGRRQAWLIFCCGVAHALHVCAALARRGVSCATVTAKTPDDERARIIADFRAGRLQAITNCEVLTTGFDVPHIDLVALLRPTLSTGLYVQMAGRGTRKADGKQNCLLLDFGGNVRRHGPIDCVDPNNKGEVPVKQCPRCASIVRLGTSSCPDCGFEWPVKEPMRRERNVKHDASADTLAPLSGALTWLPVRGLAFCGHFSRASPLRCASTFTPRRCA